MDISLLPSYSAFFLAAGILTWLLTFGVRRLALRLGIIARRDLRRRHDGDVPLLGGTPFYVVLVVSALALWGFPALGFGEPLNGRFVACFLAAITLVYGIGAVDDWIELKALPKFVAQILAAGLILLSEPRLPQMLERIALPDWVIAIGLVLWIVGITNAMNMIDGLDGLCTGIAGLTGVTMAFIALNAGAATPHSLIFTVILAGCCAGFLVHNFNPAKVFLGDSGSMLLGFVLAVMSVKFEVKRPVFVSLSLPLFLLGLPVLDAALSMLRRTRKRRSPFRGDRGHLHHRLQQLGMGQRAAVLLLWCGTAYLDLVAVALAHIPTAYSIYVYACVVPTVGFAMMALYYLERRLSFQNARYGRLFARKGSVAIPGPQEVADFVLAQIAFAKENGRPFTVVICDTSEFMNQLAHERPIRMVEFFMGIYTIFRDRLRETDLVARVGEHKIVAVLEGAGIDDGSDKSVLRELRAKLKTLQLDYHVFQSSSKEPEGYTVLRFPEDQGAILQLFGQTGAPGKKKRAA